MIKLRDWGIFLEYRIIVKYMDFGIKRSGFGSFPHFFWFILGHSLFPSNVFHWYNQGEKIFYLFYIIVGIKHRKWKKMLIEEKGTLYKW